MSASISLIGNLTRDAEVKAIGSNNALAFSVAVNSGYGEKKSVAFYNCTYFRKSDALAPLLVKGTRVFVTGDLVMRSWTNKEGKEQTSPSVTVDKVELVGEKPGASSPAASSPTPAAAKKPAKAAEVPEDEDAPF